MMVPTVRYHREDEVDEEDGIIQPQGDEHNEPGPANSLIKSVARRAAYFTRQVEIATQ